MPCDRPAWPSIERWGMTVGVLVLTAGLAGFDRWFFEHVSCTLETKERPFDLDFYTLTKPLWLFLRFTFGYGFVALAVLGGVMIVRWRRMPRHEAAAVCLIVVGLAANVVQGAIGRLRPNQAESQYAFAAPFSELLSKTGVSFPSGEAATAFAAAVVLSSLFPRWTAGVLVAALLTAVARLVNGAHYPSDVAAGALFGWFATRWLLPRIAVLLRRTTTTGPGLAQSLDATV